jgi:hypothetical protein
MEVPMLSTQTAFLTPSRPAARRNRWQAILPLGALLLAAGCAGAKVENMSMAPVHAPVAPSTVRVDVALASDLRTNVDASKAAQLLQADLVKRYRKAGLSAFPSVSQPATPGSATVHVRVSRADAGSRAQRMLIGFGAGKSTLRSDVTFDIEGDASPALSLSASTNSGRKPGLILPGAIAAATGEASRLAIGAGVGVLFETRAGLSKEADRSAKLIVKQTRKLYQTSGWRWPSDKPEQA